MQPIIRPLQGYKTENKQSIYIFIATLIFVFAVYEFYDKWNSWTCMLTRLRLQFSSWNVAYGEKTRKLDLLDYWRPNLRATIPL